METSKIENLWKDMDGSNKNIARAAKFISLLLISLTTIAKRFSEKIIRKSCKNIIGSIRLVK